LPIPRHPGQRVADTRKFYLTFNALGHRRGGSFSIRIDGNRPGFRLRCVDYHRVLRVRRRLLCSVREHFEVGARLRGDAAGERASLLGCDRDQGQRSEAAECVVEQQCHVGEVVLGPQHHHVDPASIPLGHRGECLEGAAGIAGLDA